MKTATIIWIFLFAGLLALGCAVNISEGNDLHANAVRATATVTAVNHGKATTYDLTFTDQDGQAQRVGYTENLEGSPKVADHVDIYYSSAKPTDPDEVTDVRLGPPGSYQYSAARNLGLFSLIPLAAGIYGIGIRVREERQQEQANT